MTNAGSLFQSARSVLKWSFLLFICSFLYFRVIEFNCEYVCVCGPRSLPTRRRCGYWDDLFSGLNKNTKLAAQ